MTAVPKNDHFDVPDDIVNKYNNSYHKTIKMKPTDVKFNSYVAYNADFNDKLPKVQVGEYQKLYEYQNSKTFLLKDILQTGLRKFL